MVLAISQKGCQYWLRLPKQS